MIQVEVAYARPDRQEIVPVNVPEEPRPWKRPSYPESPIFFRN